MFTGLIETTGQISQLSQRGPGLELRFSAPTWLSRELTLGESVAVDGACLTVTAFTDHGFTVDASSETVERTSIRDRRVGDDVHLERALKLGDRLGGHWVSGHIDATGTIRSRTPLGEAICLWFDAPSSVLRYIVEKGSIAIDGASLTVNEFDDHGFSIVLIPHSQGILKLSDRPVGYRVNLEADILGKYVERLLGISPPHSETHKQVDLSLLAQSGFLS